MKLVRVMWTMPQRNKKMSDHDFYSAGVKRQVLLAFISKVSVREFLLLR